MRLFKRPYFLIQLILSSGGINLYAQCPDVNESSNTIVVVDETCAGAEDGSISIDFVNAAGNYAPGLGDLDPAGDYRYALWDASIPGYVYDDIGIAPPTSPINPNIYIDYTAPNNIVFRDLPPNSGSFGYFIILERQNGNNCSQIYTNDPFGVIVGPGQPLPTATLAGGGAVCADEPLPDVIINFTGAAPYDFTYTVSGVPVNVIGHNSDIYTINNAAPGIYQVTALSDDNGCTGTDLGATATVVVNPLPVPTINGPNNVCFGDVGLYTTESGTGESNYVWQVLGGIIIGGGTSSDPTVQIRWDGLGPYSVSVNYDNSFGCDATAPTVYPVIVNPLPVPTLSGLLDICLGSTEVYTTESGSGENNYIWNVSGGSIVSGGTVADSFVEVLWDGSAPYEISISYTDGNGCSALNPTVVPVNVNPLPVPNISGSNMVCFGSQELYSTDSGAGESNFIWTVTGGTVVSGGTPADPTVEILWDGSAPHEVSVNYTDPNGCAASSPTLLAVTVNPLPSPTITGPASVCFGTVNLYSTESGSGENGYAWAIIGGTIVSGGTTTDATVEILWDGAGPYEVSVNYTDANGCTAAVPTLLPVNVIPLPIPSLDGPGIVCELSTELYTTDSTAGQSNFVWTVSGGTVVAGGTMADPSVQVIWDGSAPYEVSVSYTDINGCVASPPTLLPVAVNPQPVPVLIGNATVCFGSTELYTTDSGAGETNYSWSVSGGTIVNGGTAADPTIEILWDGVAPYEVSINYTDVSGCTAVNPTVLPVNVNNPPTAVTFTGTGPICQNEDADLTITVSGGSQPYTVYLSKDGGTTISDTVLVPDTSPLVYNAGPLSATTTFSLIRVIDQNGCELDPASLPADITVDVYIRENVVLSLPNLSGDIGDQLVLPVSVQGFNNIVTVNLSITWDENIIRFLGVENIAGISELDPTDFNLADSSTLTLVWSESSATGQSLADGLSLFDIRFELLGPDCFASAISFISSPISISVVDGNLCDANLTLNDGSVNVGGSGVSTAPVTAFADTVNCLGDVVPQLIASGVNVQWYADQTLTNLIGSGNTYTPGLDNSIVLDTTFYATQTIGACSESLPDSSRIQYIDIPSVPPVPGQARYEICLNDPPPTLVATGVNIRWYSDPGLTNLVGTGNTYTPGPGELDTSTADTTYFYMVQSNACGNGPYDSTSVHVKSQSYPPIVNSLTTVCVGDPAPNLTALGTTIRWYSDAGLTNLIATGNNFTPDSTLLDMGTSGTTTFYATQDDGCGESIGAAVAVNVIWCIVDCSGINASVSTVNPGCSASNGEIQISASGGTGFYTYQLISPDSILVSNKTGLFTGLLEGMYVYDIVDDTASCITERDTVILTDPSNIIAVADTSSFVNSTCYDQPWGRAIINVTGGTGPFEYSINGFTWNSFVSGEYIDSLPPLGSYLILVRENSSSICLEQVPVTINNEYPQIQFTYSTVDATCSDDDGSIIIETLSGGLEPYEMSLEFAAFTPVDLNNLPVYDGLSSGLKNIRVRDINNCIIENSSILVDFPGSVIANIQTIPPTCAGSGMDGQVRIYIDSMANTIQPPYQFGFAKEDTPESEVILQSIPANIWVTIDTLTNGNYYVLLSGATACESRTDVVVTGGPTAITFEITDVQVVPCKGENGTGSVTVNNVTGDSTQIYLLELIALPSANVVYAASLVQDDFIGGYTIDGSVTDQIVEGQYQIRLSQNQSGCNLSSISNPFEILEPEFNLGLDITGITASWIDSPSGTISLEVEPSGGDPYETRIETVMANFPGQDIVRNWEEVLWDGNAYSFTHEELYSGVYEVSIRDAYGCELFEEVIIGYDTAIFVPNVFTPNNDSYNDYFYIRNLPNAGSGTVLVVSNRWGKTVFESNDYNYNNLWDGGDSPDGTYYYRLDIPDKGTFKGWVEIWRGEKR